MNKVYLLTHSVFIILLLNLTGFAYAECRKDTILYFEYNGVNKDILGRTLNEYNSQNLISRSTYQDWNTSTLKWDNKTQYDYIYDGNKNLLKYTNSAYSGGWKEANRYQYIYDANNNLIEMSYQIANGSGIFINSTKNTYSYNSDNKITEKLSFSWNTSSSSWDHESYRTSYTYNANKQLTVELFEQWQTGSSSWISGSKTVYTYDGFGNNSAITDLIWNTTSNQWDNFITSDYTYNSKKQITQIISQSWTNNAWKNTSRRTYTFNTNDDLIERLTEKWTGSAWANNGKNTWDFDANHDNIATDNYSIWSVDKYTLHDRQEYICTHLSGLAFNNNPQKGISIYPNPANGNTLNMNTDVACEYSMVDINGQIISTGKLQTGTNSINISSIDKSGLYFIKTNVGVMKVVIER